MCNKKAKVIRLNTLAEVLGSGIFVFLYFLFVQRSATELVHNGFSVQLAMSIGLAYFVGVYLPFYTYRIHIFSFISIIEAFNRKKWSRLFQKLGAQLGGAILGVFFFVTFFHDQDLFSQLNLSINYDRVSSLGLMFQMTFVTLVSLFYHYMRFYSKANHAYGHLLMAFVIGFVLSFVPSWWLISSINGFGLLILSAFGYLSLLDGAVVDLLLIHFAGPVLGIIIAGIVINALRKRSRK